MVLDLLKKIFKRKEELDIDSEFGGISSLETTSHLAGNFQEQSSPSPPNFSTEYLSSKEPLQTFTNTQQFLQPTAYLPQIQSQQTTFHDIELMKQQIMVLASKIDALNSKIDILLQKIQMLEQFLYYRR
ncbi:MAG TPA: hypothetical protein EYH09_02385 [Candidatus Nanopusillus sp.]|nr:hypothetical protein [Candidatus Nanopusillus sp.]